MMTYCLSMKLVWHGKRSSGFTRGEQFGVASSARASIEMTCTGQPVILFTGSCTVQDCG